MPGLRLQGSSAIVTGGGSGLCLVFAKQLHARGCNVLIADIGLRPEAEVFIESAAANNGTKVTFQKTDVTDWEQLERMFSVAEELFGTTPDLVCAGAGVYEPPGASFWADKDKASHYKILDINLIHPIKTTRIAIRQMLKHKKRGCIVHVSSLACETASLITPLYSVSKHGVAAFVRGLADLESKCGIRVACVAPGSIKTPLMLEDPRVSSWLNPQKDYILDPAVVASAMMAVVENTEDKYPAGIILEVTEAEEEKWRLVPLYNNPGPQGRAGKISNKDDGLKDIEKILEQDAGFKVSI
ncbi:hypothetical protein B7463_g10053, partial [Scytalidium lignicola]